MYILLCVCTIHTCLIVQTAVMSHREVVKGNCSELLLFVLLYYITDIMFNCLILLKLSLEICSSIVAKKCILPFYFWFEGATGKMSQEAEVKSSKWLNRDGTKN